MPIAGGSRGRADRHALAIGSGAVLRARGSATPGWCRLRTGPTRLACARNPHHAEICLQPLVLPLGRQSAGLPLEYSIALWPLSQPARARPLSVSACKIYHRRDDGATFGWISRIRSVPFGGPRRWISLVLRFTRRI